MSDPRSIAQREPFGNSEQLDGRGFGIPMHDRTGRYKQSTVLRVQGLVTAHGWRIHPRFIETLMGFPLEWSAIAPSETALPPTLENTSDD